MKLKKKQKVLVCLSGGVDSSVAALLLLQQGYEVVGAYMKQWSDSSQIQGVCPWKQDRRDALRVAAHLGIPLLTLDFEKEYKEWVVKYMFEEYKKFRTPNPDVMCNKFIKFGVWLEKAKELGFDFMATGHYAQVKKVINKKQSTNYSLLEAEDKEKDQTYFLHQLTQEQLSRTMFPVGGYTKQEVRTLARKYELPTAERAESMGICFIGEIPMKEFLQQEIKQKKGKIVTTSGEQVGEHDGLAFYTIGQRHGFEQKGGGNPLFVVGKNKKKNQLIVGAENDPLLLHKEAELDQTHWIHEEDAAAFFDCYVRLRHRGKMIPCTVEIQKNKMVKIIFQELQKALTPGQFAVFYSSNFSEKKCLGGGIIAE